MAAHASTNTVVRRRPGLMYLIMMAAAASVAACIALVSARMYAPLTGLTMLWGLAAAVAAVGSMDEAARSRMAAVTLVIWFATTPVAWFFVRFPFEKSIITYERLVFGLVGLLSLSRFMRLRSDPHRRLSRRYDRTDGGNENPEPRTTRIEPILVDRGNSLIRTNPTDRPNPRSIPSEVGMGATKFEIVWLLLTILACFSAAAVSFTTGYAVRTAVDAFALPLIAFYGARTYVQSPQLRRYLVVAAMVLGLVLLAMGSFEFLTGINLLPYEGSELIREGELRVNGPFITDTSFAIISLMLTLFLRSAPRMFNLKFDLSARILYAIGIAAAIVSCLLPLFRAVAIALAVCWAVQGIVTAGTEGGPAAAFSLRARRLLLWRSRLRPVVTVGIASILLAAAVLLLVPANIKDRLANPRNAYSRLLSWRVASKIIYHHPVFGVGLSNYVDYFDQEYSGGRSELELELDTHIVEHPHSNVVWIATELGLVGLALYLAANILLLVPAYRAVGRGRSARTRAAGACFIVLMAAYWIPGLELTSGMYSELNLYFFFLLGLIFPLLWSDDPAEGGHPEWQQ
jgi:hypothetical protein